MTEPEEQEWMRVERLAGALDDLPTTEVVREITRLAAAGESPTVLTLLRGWMSLETPAPPVAAGMVIAGRYRLVSKLGDGGMGTVWSAWQPLIGREVAIKIIHPELSTRGVRDRFLREMEILGKLVHPGIVRIYDAGMAELEPVGPVPFFAMELVEGQPLDRWAKSNQADHGRILRMMSSICCAVRSAHERRVVHRDLKPGNILVRPDGAPVVLDFGISRLAGVSVGDESGVFSGTPIYAAPEQHLGRDLDFQSGERCDVYSAGAVLFELLTGRRLIDVPKGSSMAELRRRVLEGPLPRVSEFVPQCPRSVDEVVACAVRRDPSDRIDSMAAFVRALDRAAASCESMVESNPAWRPAEGAVIPGTSWKLEQKLGEGGVGEVWSGHHPELEGRRVFKFCDSEEKARTLRRELTLYRLLRERIGRNPHFIQLHEVSLDEPPWYLMMDYADATDLATWAAAVPGGLDAVPVATRIEIVAQVAEALQEAHDAGILHRDIKPANLLVGKLRADAAPEDPRSSLHAPRADAGIHVLVADFGIGQIVADAISSDVTRAGFTRTVSHLSHSQLSGTMLYIAPEVLEGQAATARSDLYSLGVVLWQLLTGNLGGALDPADWAARISDPLLRSDLAKCLTGQPDRRWRSAGELAASLRSLDARRTVELQRQEELRSRERAAYRRGVLRTAAAAGVIVSVVGTLAWWAVLQRRSALRSHGITALEQATSLRYLGPSSTGRLRGLQLLETASEMVSETNRATLRTAAAGVLGLVELEKTAAPKMERPRAAAAILPHQPGEVLRVVSLDGSRIAVAHDIDGLNGAVEVFDGRDGRLISTVQRKAFPWIPIAEPGLFEFGLENRLLAVGGSATSRHVVVCDVESGDVKSYLYHDADPVACAWHLSGRWLATSGSDAVVRIWDLHAAAVPTRAGGTATNAFDLPPLLDVPALDVPTYLLRGHRGAVRHLTFSEDGEWMASLDEAGYLRVFSCQSLKPVPASPLPGVAGTGAEVMPPPRVLVELHVDRQEEIQGIAFRNRNLLIQRNGGATESYQLNGGELPAEVLVRRGIERLAWNRSGSSLAVASVVDLDWIDPSSNRIVAGANGANPFGVDWTDSGDRWIAPSDDSLFEFRPPSSLVSRKAESRELGKLVPGTDLQGTRATLSATDDGRVAIYYARRIQFFENGGLSRSNSIAIGNGGILSSFFWDRTGGLLGTTYLETNQSQMRVLTWDTTRRAPTVGVERPARIIDASKVVPANDGRHLLTRNRIHGIHLLDSVTGEDRQVDESDLARQDSPMVASADGRFLVYVFDRTNLRILRIPGGDHFADLVPSRPAAISRLEWHRSSRRLAAATEDGFVQLWNLGPWWDWLDQHQLNR